MARIQVSYEALLSLILLQIVLTQTKPQVIAQEASLYNLPSISQKDILKDLSILC